MTGFEDWQLWEIEQRKDAVDSLILSYEEAEREGALSHRQLARLRKYKKEREILDFALTHRQMSLFDPFVVE